MVKSLDLRRFFQTLKASSEFPWLLMCALALVVVIYLSLSDWQQVRQANEQAKTSETIIHELHVLSYAVQAAESSERGYVLTSSSSYLEPYYEARKTVPGTLAGVRRLAGISINS